MVIILTILIVGLLVTSQSSLQIASHHRDALEARIAAVSAVEMVKGQIRRATIAGIDAGTKRGTYSWASQPGALRVFNQAGTEREIDKLYSSSEMIAPGGASLNSDVPFGWRDSPDEFVDINEPVRRGDYWVFPVASPVAIGSVAGFSSTLSDTGGPSGPDDRLVMPVRWLYLHEDGTVTIDPTQGDPYARVAFWTDDESSKINLNTASATDSKSAWDIPRTSYYDDWKIFAWRQPVENEFNRYPGHPATVSLTTVFPDLANKGNAWLENLINATPRYRWGGSRNASVQVDASTAIENSKQERLYATPDEFLYSPSRAKQLSLSGPALDSLRFFLTTSSRSSDLNLFGQPRVTIWPISGIDDNRHRTIYDRTIAFNSTLGSGSNSKHFYFLRSNPDSQTADWDLYARNREIFDYLQDLTRHPIPGFGGNFLTKYDYDGVSGEWNQILTEVFDYIRTVNLNETYKAREDGLAGESFVSYTNDRISGNSGRLEDMSDSRGSGWVMPILTPYGRGAGRVPVVSEIGLWFIQTTTLEGTEPGGKPIWKTPDPPEVQPGLLVETFSPMQGILAFIPKHFSYRVKFVTMPTINGQPIFPDRTAANSETEPTFLPPNATYGSSQNLGGTDGFAWTMSGGLPTGYPNSLGHDISTNPFQPDNPFLTGKPNAIKLPPGATSFTITPGKIEIELLNSPNAPTKGTGTTLQTYSITIPETTVPVPTPVIPFESFPNKYVSQRKNGWDARGREPPRFNPSDVVRGMAIKHGDFRTMAYMPDIPSNFFQGSFQTEHSLRDYRTRAFRGAKNGSYVSGLNYAPEDNTTPTFTTPRPKIPAAINGLMEEGWDADFDTGMANIVDGPYLNKSDEGALPAGKDPYYFERSTLAEGLFSPFRQVPCAVVFGSLPTGVKHVEAGGHDFWRTLAFCPNPLSGSSHRGLSDPKDHLLLDFFTMPIVEPYAISEPFSTAGRLNMNWRMAPFNHIIRQTALHAALAVQQVIAISDNSVQSYKTTDQQSPANNTVIRFPVDVGQTLIAMDNYLTAKGQTLFHSASEICDIYLVPSGRTAENVEAWWSTRRLTGNNIREKPYASLYPLLTTKSNVFTTHVRAQAIKRTPSGNIVVRGEYRGSVLFERYLDPQNPIFTDGSVDPDQVSLEPYFQFRTLTSKQFDP